MGLTIGLTGGIGSGKSTAAQCLAEAGAVVVDADAIARQITAPGGAALPALAARFDAVRDGVLDRAALRDLIFADPAARDALEALLHPLIQAEAHRQAAGHSLVVFDVPLLVESGHWRARTDRVLVIDCHPDVQRSRVLQRPGWTEEQFEGVLAAQTSRAARRAAADAVIDNTALPLPAFQSAVIELMQRWRVEESAA